MIEVEALRPATSVRTQGYTGQIVFFAMELSDSSHDRVSKQGAVADRESLGASVTIYVRLWTYGGPSQQLNGLPIDEDPEVIGLIRGVIDDGKGKIASEQRELLTAHFENGQQALTAAKGLQQRFLTFHRSSEPQQVVPGILVASIRSDSESGQTQSLVVPADMLANGTSGQILVFESVYETVKSTPGFTFNLKPVRESGGTGGPAAIYELLWTDESTYGHLRQASGNEVSRTVGRYQIQAELGRGAMGVVYKAHDELIGRTVALKTIEINPNMPDRDSLIERLKQEAKAAGGLDHPNIITIYDVGQENDIIYLSMQFIEGKTLLDVMSEVALPPLPTLISYADQILSGVGFAHARGVIHRDLKPANLMLTSQGVIKVLDFGIAKIENASLTQTGLVVGTPSHMAPEQVAGKKVDHRADIFALGSVFYELVTREKPFRGDVTTILYKIMHEDPVAPSLINPALPGGIDAIIRKALAKDPNERFQSCEEMREAFLEQGDLLHVAPVNTAPAVAAAAVAAKPAQRPPTASFPHYLLEDTPKKKASGKWPGIIAAVLLVTLGAVDWSFYTKSRTGVFPAPVANIVGLFHHGGIAPAANAKTEVPAPQQAEGDTSGVVDPGPAVGSNNADKTPSAQNPDQATPATSDSTAVNGQMPAAAQVTNQALADKSQPATDNSHSASAGPVDSAAQTAAASQSPNVPNQGSTAAGQNSAASSSTKTQSAISNPGPPTGGSTRSTSPQSGGQNAVSSADDTAKAQKKTAPEAPASVDGFTRKDIPELLQQADAAVDRGDNRLARYEYGLILKLNPGNAAARAGLRRVQSTP